MSTIDKIQFLRGFNVKPSSVSEEGVVKFTDGTNEVIPNQIQCEAYGYTYDKESGNSYAFRYNPNLEESISNISNNIQGSNNTTELGTNNSCIMGESNTIKGLSRNNIIVGSENQIANSVNNSSVFGNYGFAERAGEFVVGGGGFGGTGLGYAQSSVLTLTGTTTDASATSLFVNGDSSTTIIARDLSLAASGAFQAFEANVIGARTGGSSGSGAVNDRIFIRVTGLIHLKVIDQTSTTLGSFGTVTGWAASVAFSGTNDMLFQVTGAANMNLSWSCTLNMYELKV